MKQTIEVTNELLNLLTADICDDEFTVEELLQMITVARESIPQLNK